MLAPALAVLGLFGLGPMGYTVYLAFRGAPASGESFVGFAHFERALASGDFWNSFEVTLYYAAGVVPATLALGLLIADTIWTVQALRPASGQEVAIDE